MLPLRTDFNRQVINYNNYSNNLRTREALGPMVLTPNGQVTYHVNPDTQQNLGKISPRIFKFSKI